MIRESDRCDTVRSIVDIDYCSTFGRRLSCAAAMLLDSGMRWPTGCGSRGKLLAIFLNLADRSRSYRTHGPSGPHFVYLPKHRADRIMEICPSNSTITPRSTLSSGRIPPSVLPFLCAFGCGA